MGLVDLVESRMCSSDIRALIPKNQYHRLGYAEVWVETDVSTTSLKRLTNVVIKRESGLYRTTVEELSDSGVIPSNALTGIGVISAGLKKNRLYLVNIIPVNNKDNTRFFGDLYLELDSGYADRDPR